VKLRCGRVARHWSCQLAVPLALALGGLGMFTTLQRQLIYFPERASERALLAQAAAIGLQPWHGREGELIGWRSTPSGEAERRMLVFHGNAGYALHRVYYAAGLAATRAGWDAYLFEYPGYGARAGEPSESSIGEAATRALQGLLESDARPLYLTGESLGCGVASQLAASYPDAVQGLLLVTPFTRLGDVAAHHYPFLPVRVLLSERYDSVAALARYRGPVAFLLAGRDEVVPAALGRQLHDGYAGPKWLRIQPQAGHNSLDVSPRAPWWREASEFLTALPARRQGDS
jgi:pimeloyl-ACP methyl ester carboxylesterase